MGRQSIVAVMMLAACETVEERVDYDPTTDFSRYHTYAWVESTVEEGNATSSLLYNPLVQQRIRDAVSRTLDAKGFREKLPPDFVVALTAGTQPRRFVQYVPTTTLPPGYATGFYPQFYQPIVTDFTAGAISIDMFDAVTGRAIWHGSAVKIVEEGDQEPAAIQSLVDGLLVSFPPPLAATVVPAATEDSPERQTDAEPVEAEPADQ